MKSICLVYPVEKEMNATSKKETDAGIEGPRGRWPAAAASSCGRFKELHL
jgi:hypothetical protein